MRELRSSAGEEGVREHMSNAGLEGMRELRFRGSCSIYIHAHKKIVEKRRDKYEHV